MDVIKNGNHNFCDVVPVMMLTRGESCIRNGALLVRVELCELQDNVARTLAEAAGLLDMMLDPHKERGPVPRPLRHPVWVVNVATGRVWAIEGDEPVTRAPNALAKWHGSMPDPKPEPGVDAGEVGSTMDKVLGILADTERHMNDRVREATGLLQRLERRAAEIALAVPHGAGTGAHSGRGGPHGTATGRFSGTTEDNTAGRPSERAAAEKEFHAALHHYGDIVRASVRGTGPTLSNLKALSGVHDALQKMVEAATELERGR